MTTLQKIILTILSFSLVGVLAGFILFLFHEQSPSASPMTVTPDCDIIGLICESELSDVPLPTPETAKALDPTPGITLSIPTMKISLSDTEVPFTSMTATSRPCPETFSGGLVTEMRTITSSMPLAGSNGFVEPTSGQITGWESLIQAIMDDDLSAACSIIQSHGFPYDLIQFTDAYFKDQQYIMLRELYPIQVGWGTYVFRTGDDAAPLVVEIPHPGADWNTEIEGVEIFRKVNARALLIAGTHRCANDIFSPCAGTTIACGQVEPYRISDVGHGVQNMFHATHRTLVECRSKTIAIQLHGNSVSNCPDVFLSNGTTDPGNLTGSIYEAVESSCKDFEIDLADGEPGECAFTGGGAPQAVLTNSCRYSNPPDACTGYALHPSGPDQFISIEQSVKVRQNYDCLVRALNDIFNP
jgi:hypothetical protein